MENSITDIPVKVNTESSVCVKYKKTLTSGEKITLVVSRIILILVTLITLFPIFAIVVASLSGGTAFVQTTILPSVWTLDNYKKVIFDTDFIIWVKNSIILCTIIATIQVGLAIPAGFAFSKLKFKGRKKALLALIILQMFPSFMALSGILAVAYNYGGFDSFPVLILIQCGGSAYNIWLMKGNIDGIPDELMEAAEVDGATTFQVFIKIILPLIKSMIAVIFLFSFIGAYSEYIYTSALMKDPSHQTIATGLRQFIRDKYSANWTQYSAAAVLSSIPIVALFLANQKFIAKGLISGAVKG